MPLSRTDLLKVVFDLQPQISRAIGVALHASAVVIAKKPSRLAV